MTLEAGFDVPVYTVLEFLLYFLDLRSTVGTANTKRGGIDADRGHGARFGCFLPSTPIEFIEGFLTVFVVVLGCLKIVTYVSESFFAHTAIVLCAAVHYRCDGLGKTRQPDGNARSILREIE